MRICRQTRQAFRPIPIIAKASRPTSAALALAALTAACASPPRFYEHLPQAEKPNRDSHCAIEHLKENARTGDLIVGHDLKPLSLFMSLATQTPSYYGHIGVIVVENETPYVYEALGEFHLKGNGQTVFENIHGGIYKHTIEAFVQRYWETAIYRPFHEHLNTLVPNAIQICLQDTIQFDAYFDPATPELCCTEWTRTILDGVGYDTKQFSTPRTIHPDLSNVLQAFGMKATTFITADAILHHTRARAIGIVSLNPDRGTREALQDGFFLLHEKFNGTFSLSDFFEFDAWHVLRYSRNVESFFSWVQSYFSQYPTPDRFTRRNTLEIIFNAHFPTKGDRP